MADEIAPKRKKRTTRPPRASQSKAGDAAPAEKPASKPASDGDSAQSFDPLATLRALPASTSRIVEQAASILEEEIAAGIVAAKRVEGRFVDVGKMRGKDTQEVMQRFRHDAHEVLDILVDMVNIATNSLGDLTQRVITITSGQPTAPGRKNQLASPGGIPTLNVDQPVKAGQAVEIPLTLENGGDSPTEEFGFYSSDLLNATGDHIGAGQISFQPKAVTIDSHSSTPVTVVVSIPEGTIPGVYSGLVQATKLELLRAVLTIRVE
jgi:hypothetical protein